MFPCLAPVESPFTVATRPQLSTRLACVRSGIEIYRAPVAASRLPTIRKSMAISFFMRAYSPIQRKGGTGSVTRPAWVNKTGYL